MLDPARGLLRDGKPLPVGQRGIALLAALLEAEGEAVPKADLMDRAWPGLAVEEGNLTVQIAALRKALGKGSNGQEWIVTVPRLGYRLSTGPPPPGASVGGPALAVLPFQNLVVDAGQDYFCDGIVTEIITALARFKSFAVVARNSSFAYKGRAIDVRLVAEELGVRYILEGSVQGAGNRVRIGAQLVDGRTGAHIWAEQFDGELGNLFDFQDRITESVATMVEPAIGAAEIERSRRERPGSIATYDLYLRALAHLTSEAAEENAKACSLLAEAVALEPENGVLLGHAAWALEHRHTMGWPPIGADDRSRCIELARRGLRHAAGNARTMAQCGMALLQTGREYDLGLEVIRAVAIANPNDLHVIAVAATATLHCGDLDEARRFFERSLRLCPSGPDARFALTGIAMIEIIEGNYLEALSWATRSLAANRYFDATHWMLIAANAHLGRIDDARRFLAELRELAPGITLARIRAGQPAKDPRRIAPVLDGLRLAGLG